jgi:hypothetical protein
MIRDDINECEKVKITYIFINRVDVCGVLHESDDLFPITVNEFVIGWNVNSSLRSYVTAIKGDPSRNLVVYVK